MTKPFLDVLSGTARRPPPVWLMRQAGRYLPEYREVRARGGSFLDLCYTPERAVEVTLQPIRRYGFDAAILFSDILVVPDALGQEVSFEEGVGPVLVPVRDAAAVSRLAPSGVTEFLSPVYETVARVREELSDETALIGFAGGPWTVACYMVEGGTSRDFHVVKRMCFGEPGLFGDLVDRLVEASAAHLSAQAAAGAEVLQIFESHAGALPPEAFGRWVIEPVRRVVELVRQEWPEVPIIGFPRGAGSLYGAFARETGVTAVSVDTGVSLVWADGALPEGMPIQGNLDPVLLLVGGDAMREGIERIVEESGGRPHIFNLGHGVDKETRPETVVEMLRILRN